MADGTFDKTLLAAYPRNTHEPGDARGLLVHDALLDHAVGAHHVAVVARVDHDRVVGEPQVVERIEDGSNASVDLAHETPVACDEAAEVLFGGPVFLGARRAFLYVLLGFVFLQGIVEVRRQVNFVGVVEIVERTGERHVGFEKIDVEQEGLFAKTLHEIDGAAFQELRFAPIDGKARGKAAAESIAPAGVESQGQQVMVVIASCLLIAFGAVVLNVVVLNGNPLLETMLGEDLVAQMPLSHVGAPVIRIAQEFGETGGGFGKGDVVFQDTAGVGPEARHDCRARRRANRLGHVCLFENDALRSQTVQIRDADFPVAVGGHGIGTLFVGPDEEQVGFAPGRGKGPGSHNGQGRDGREFHEVTTIR